MTLAAETGAGFEEHRKLRWSQKTGQRDKWASGLPPLQALRFIVLPLTMSKVVTALRVGFSIALLGVLVEEML